MSIVFWVWTLMLAITLTMFGILTWMMFGPQGIFRGSHRGTTEKTIQLLDDEGLSEVQEDSDAQ